MKNMGKTVDGHYYNDGDTIPDLGSWVNTAESGSLT